MSPHAMAKEKKPRNALLDRAQYVALRVVSAGLHSWPIDLNLQIAKFIGGLWFRFGRKHRERATGNIRRSFPEKSEHDIATLAEQSMQHLIMFAVEMLFTTRLIRIDTWQKYCVVDRANFGPLLELLMKSSNSPTQGRGMIMLTGHYGNWEVLGYTLATLGFGSTAVARPLDNPYINDWVMGVRERRGQRIIDKKGAIEEVSTTLARGGVVGFIADQNAGKKGMFVDFFGRKASTYKSIGLLAMEYKVPVVVGCAVRVGDRFKYRMHMQDVIRPEDWKDQDDPLRYITQRYTKAIEDFVRAEPGQYLWVHRRWKTRPKGEASERFD